MASNLTTPTSRRDFLAIAGATACGSMFAHTASGARPEPMLQGIFPIMQTPFTESGALDLETLAR